MQKYIVVLLTFLFITSNSFAGDDIFFTGTCVFISDSGYLWVKPESNLNDFYLGGVENRWDSISTFTKNNTVLDSKRDIVLKTTDTEDSQIVVYLPTSPNGEEKIKCSIWVNPVTKTLKASPVEPITCGGFK